MPKSNRNRAKSTCAWHPGGVSKRTTAAAAGSKRASLWRALDSPQTYSRRSASTGEIRHARNAGTSDAISAEPTSASAALRMTSGL